MDVAVSALRADLSTWIDLARAGEEVVVTDRGTPVVRLVAVDAAPLLDELARTGVLSPAPGPRPVARNTRLARATGPVSELITEQRR